MARQERVIVGTAIFGFVGFIAGFGQNDIVGEAIIGGLIGYFWRSE